MPQTIRQYLRSRVDPVLPKPSLNELIRGQWSKKFEQLMRNRLVMGALRYETFEEKRHKNHNYKLVESAIYRLEQYQKSGNMEHLVDVANLCMIEYESPTNPKACWEALDDANHHVEK